VAGTRRDESSRCIIVGAGPAGLTAGYELSKLGIPAIILEKDACVGGLSRTVDYKGYRFDIGGHRFFTKVDFVRDLWSEILGEEDLLERPRLSRIHYQRKFFDYPIRPAKALLGLGPLEGLRIVGSYLYAQLFPSQVEETFEQWVCNRFGRRLFEVFFKTYTEKVWGIPCHEIRADWAAQRIKNLNLFAALRDSLLRSRAPGREIATTLIQQFHYPRLGPGMMWERCRELVAEKGCPTVTGALVTRVRHRDGRIRSVCARLRSGAECEELGTHFLSSMPIRDLVRALDPAPPPEILAAADRLRHRDFLMVALILDRAETFPDNWIYVHSPEVRVGRIQNFKNWSPAMVPDPAKTALGLEYFVQEGDELWSAPDAELVALGGRECASLGLIRADDVVDGTVVRMPKAYPVYDAGYAEALSQVRAYLGTFANLQLMGRNGLHRYNNQDHSMVTAVFAARNVAGARHDVWNVNVEQEYHEEARATAEGRGDRAVPGSAERGVGEAVIASVFARYDPVALGGAVGAILGVGLFLATAILLIRGGDPVGPNLSLLGNYLLGFRVSWAGAWLGMAEALAGGFAFGWALAEAINAVVGWHEAAFRRRLELHRALRLVSVDDP
jgi:protoporphyrinogen oxidase